MMNIQGRFGIRVRRFRLELGISQQELGARSRISRENVSNIERGMRNVSLDVIERLAAALEVSMAELMPEQPAKRKA